MDRTRLQRRVRGRELAGELLPLIELDGDVESIDAFLDELASKLRPKSTDEAKAEQRKLSQLAAQTLPRGQYQGQRMDDIPRNYLHWWVRDSEESIENVTAYLKSTAHLHGE